MRSALLKIHLYLGLTAAIFLVILGLTGSVMAFEGDIDRWLHPSLWYVKAGPRVLGEGELIAKVQRKFAPARVGGVEMSQHPDLAQMMHLTDRSAVTVNPYDGVVLGRMVGQSQTQKILGNIHQLHLRLATGPRGWIGPAGKVIVSYAGLILCLLAPTGLILCGARSAHPFTGTLPGFGAASTRITP